MSGTGEMLWGLIPVGLGWYLDMTMKPTTCVLLRVSCRGAAGVLLFLVSFAAPAGAAQLVEGFEDISAVRVTRGKLSAVSLGEGVTQGKQAAEVPPAAEIHLKVEGRDCREKPWLKVDVMAVQPLVHSLRLTLSAQRWRRSCVAYVRPGKDTIALPLSVVGASFANGFPDGDVAVTVTNLSSTPLIMDNIRLEPAVKAPAGSILIDFGGQRQPCWPGFEAGAVMNRCITWSGQSGIHAGNARCPDPLTGDFVGRTPGDKTVDYFDVNNPTSAPMTAWLWITHCGVRNSQAMEYVLRFRNRTALRKRRTRKQMLGTDGLLEGMDEPWTPQWFDTVYAGRFYDVVQLSLRPGHNRVDVGNCQLAAMLAGPTSELAGLSECVEQVKSDLSRYRRQFVVGDKIEPACKVVPTDAESRTGAMVFRPPPDEAFSATWEPAESNRVAKIEVVGVNGGIVVIPLVVVPLRNTSLVGAAVLGLRSAGGRSLVSPGDTPAAFFYKTVPRVSGGQVKFQPWIEAKSYGPVAERRVIHLAAVVRISPSAGAGLYSGQLRVNFTGGQARVPLEIEVHHLARRTGKFPTFGAASSTSSRSLYCGLAASLAPAQRASLTGKIRQSLLTDGLNALTLSSATFATGSKLSVNGFVRNLKTYPAKSVRGETLIGVGSPLWQLDRWGIQLGTQRFREKIRALVQRTSELTAEAKLSDYCFYFGRVWDARGLDAASRKAAPAVAAGGRTAVLVGSSIIRRLGADRAKSLLRPISTLLIIPDTSEVRAQIKAFKALGGDRRAYVYVYRPDRFRQGFYARSVEADGYYLHDVFMPGPPFKGFHVNGTGLVAPRSDGGIAPTLAMLRCRQADDDYLLMLRAEAILKRADDVKAPADELARILRTIRSRSSELRGVRFDGNNLRTSSVLPVEMESWRTVLIRAAADVSKSLPKK